jgi:predicted dehydrogenase
MTQDRKLRGAVVGYGFISGKGHVPAYQQRSDVELVAVADVSEARRRLAKDAVVGARVYESAGALLENEKGLDFIDIATPPVDHASIAKAALARGLHVICEKPFATTVEDATSMLLAAKKAERVIFPCHNYKHAPVVRAIREILDSGRIGKVHSITLSTFRHTHAIGVAEWKPDWRRDPAISGGGIAMDHGSHSFYLTFEWMGSYPTAVTGKMGCSNPAFPGTEDNFSAVLTFPNGLAHAHLTWTAGVRKVIYTLQGERGAITVSDDDLELALMKKGPSGATTWEFEKTSIPSHWMDASHVSWYNSLFDRFRRAVDARDFVNQDALEALRSVEIITAAYRSSREGCREILLDKSAQLAF